MLVDEKTQTVVTHIRRNNITMFNYHDVDINDLNTSYKSVLNGNITVLKVLLFHLIPFQIITILILLRDF